MLANERFPQWIKDNQLLQFTRKCSSLEPYQFVGRLLCFHEVQQLVLIYHDDEKKVYNLSLDELETILIVNE